MPRFHDFLELKIVLKHWEGCDRKPQTARWIEQRVLAFSECEHGFRVFFHISKSHLLVWNLKADLETSNSAKFCHWAVNDIQKSQRWWGRATILNFRWDEKSTLKVRETSFGTFELIITPRKGDPKHFADYATTRILTLKYASFQRS